MIAVFPKIYEDELAYSIFARYHIYSGHITFRATAEELFVNKDVIPSPEFIVALTDDAKKMITRGFPLEIFLEKHTLLPYYVRFLPLKRRRKAFQLLMDMDRTFYDALYIRKNKTARRRYMKYCPLCAASDRARYGETYWHRKHQLTGIDICLEHRCRLDETDIEIAAEKHRYKLVAAETAVPYTTQANMKISVQEQKVAAYVLRIFEADLDYTTDIPINKFLHTRLEGTPYTSLRGEQVFARKLFDQISREYATLGNLERLIVKDHRISGETFSIRLTLHVIIHSDISSLLFDRKFFPTHNFFECSPYHIFIGNGICSAQNLCHKP